ncbi:PksE [Streptomyces sp. Mg1]|nr:PksE [Streptomyces sp. Mg1]
MTRIAIVGMACRYPDATSPGELWENAVAGRRAFRRLPSVRMNLDDYWDADPTVPDTFYARNAAVLEGYEFDRIAHKISGGTYRSTDLTHWLALDTAGRALADAGFPGGEGLPRERTGVVVGNTLTGEFSRANVMRLRWPYVRRVMAEALGDQPDWDEDRVDEFLDDVEAAYKQPFPDINEDTLAGGLANTIAGRICNQFDLGGGGYTVDGACSSSLLSVTTAGTSLVNGDIDVAVAGGVDLSIDPFEIIGFAKTGALAKGEMKLYDRGSNGFWPGEGCGMIVMMREEDALAGNHRIYATIAGWGVSSDGQGGITRPEVSGYQLALKRAYDRAGFGIDTVALFEGHGTGTAVGDATELTALMGARAAADPDAPVAAITSIKGMIGHTKAAAGVAGLIKAAMAVDNQTLPPAIGTVDPHELLTAADANLKALRKAEAWPQGTPRRAGITAMGFGGINTHVVLDEPATRRARPGPRPGRGPRPLAAGRRTAAAGRRVAPRAARPDHRGRRLRRAGLVRPGLGPGRHAPARTARTAPPRRRHRLLPGGRRTPAAPPRRAPGDRRERAHRRRRPQPPRQGHRPRPHRLPLPGPGLGPGHRRGRAAPPLPRGRRGLRPGGAADVRRHGRHRRGAAAHRHRLRRGPARPGLPPAGGVRRRRPQPRRALRPALGRGDRRGDAAGGRAGARPGHGRARRLRHDGLARRRAGAGRAAHRGPARRHRRLQRSRTDGRRRPRRRDRGGPAPGRARRAGLHPPRRLARLPLAARRTRRRLVRRLARRLGVRPRLRPGPLHRHRGRTRPRHRRARAAAAADHRPRPLHPGGPGGRRRRRPVRRGGSGPRAQRRGPGDDGRRPP